MEIPVGRGVTAIVAPPEQNRRCRTKPTTEFWSEMQRLAREEFLLSLTTLEILQERLFQAIDRRHLPD